MMIYAVRPFTITFLAILLITSTNVFSATQDNLAGKWTGTWTVGTTPLAVIMTFDASGNVTGTFPGQAFSITSGKLTLGAGNAITGTLHLSDGSAPVSNLTLSTPGAGGLPYSIKGSLTYPGGVDQLNISGPATIATKPVITSVLTATATVGQAFSYQITASNTPTSFSATGLPAGLSINTTTGLISGTPTVAGTTNVTLNATNAAGTGTATLALTVSVATTTNPPVITSVLTATATVGQAFSYQITASNTPTSFSATGLPAGLSINTTTGLISGTPSTAGLSNATLSATNLDGTDTKTLILTVTNPATNSPNITSQLAASAVMGGNFRYTITAVGFAPVYSVSGLPAGLSLTTDTISGTPSVGGLYFVTLSASNTAGKDIKILAITIGKGGIPNTAPVFVSPPTATPSPVQVNQPVTLSVVASDADGDGLGYTWDFGDGTTGYGASVNHNYASSGSYVAKVTVYDGTATNSSSVSFKVTPLPPPTQPLTLQKASIKFNFSKGSADSMTFSGSLPITKGFSPGGKTLTVTVGTYKSQFTLTNKGVGSAGGDSIKLTGKQQKSVFTTNLVNFAYTVKAANLFSALNNLGFTNANVASSSIMVPVTLVLDDAPYEGAISVTYKAKLAGTGSAK